MENIEKVFRELGRSQKVKFISKHIEYASAASVAEYIESYIFDVLNELHDNECIADYLRERGYQVTKQEEAAANENKVKLVYEFDRSEYDAYLFVLGEKNNPETEKTWEVMTKEPVVADLSKLDEDERGARILMMSIAIVSVKDKVKNQL